MSILRITLKQPAKIAAQSNGPDLKVTIGADANASPITIGFARNQDDPRRASLTTLVPGADEVLALTDPVTGDVLTVVPGNAGRAVPAERDLCRIRGAAHRQRRGAHALCRRSVGDGRQCAASPSPGRADCRSRRLRCRARKRPRHWPR